MLVDEGTINIRNKMVKHFDIFESNGGICLGGAPQILQPNIVHRSKKTSAFYNFFWSNLQLWKQEFTIVKTWTYSSKKH
jgi:hypothetical protein